MILQLNYVRGFVACLSPRFNVYLPFITRQCVNTVNINNLGMKSS